MTTYPFSYKLEFLYDDGTPSDASVFIQMRDNPPIYMVKTNKEDYDIIPDTEKNPFITKLFDIAGVTEMSLKAYRIWIMKSPTYTWFEVLDPIIIYLASFYGYTGSVTLPASGLVDGSNGTYIPTGNQLVSVNNRRPI